MFDPNEAIPQIKHQTEEEWEEAVLEEMLGDVLSSDGTIDFDKLRSKTIATTLAELYPEANQDDEP